jgi:chemotaxis response regulator CheB
MISILIADDDDLVRTGLRLIIESDWDLTVVGEAANGQEAISLARALRPDVVLMDVRMPQGSDTSHLSNVISPFPHDQAGVGDMAEERASVDSTTRLRLQRGCEIGTDSVFGTQDVHAAIHDREHVRDVGGLHVPVAAQARILEATGSGQCQQPANDPSVGERVVHHRPHACLQRVVVTKSHGGRQ